jgi:transposase
MGSHYDPDAAPTFWRLPDALWEECRPLLPPEKPLGTTGRPVVPFRRVLDGILHVLRTGCQWQALPHEFGAGATCHRRFQQWVRAGVWRRLWRAQLQRYDGPFPPSAATPRARTRPIGANWAPNGMSSTTGAARPWASCSARRIAPT